MARQQRVNRRKQSPSRKARSMGESVQGIFKKVYPSLLVAGIVFGIPYVSYQSYQFAVTSPSFAITEIEVSGGHHIGKEQVMSFGQVAPGVNIFDVDVVRIEEQLKRHEWVKDAKISTELPGTLRVELTEHEPVAIVIDRGEYMLLDGNSVPFRTMKPEELTESLFDALPLISGLQKDKLVQQEVERERALVAMQVWELWHERGLNEVAPVSEVHLDEVLGLSLIVGVQGTEVRLGWGSWSERLDRFGVVYQDLLDRGVAVDYVLVDQDGEVNQVAVGPVQTKDR